MEDEGMLGDLIQTMLEHLGYEVDTALDGERAVELYQRRSKPAGTMTPSFST